MVNKKSDSTEDITYTKTNKKGEKETPRKRGKLFGDPLVILNEWSNI